MTPEAGDELIPHIGLVLHLNGSSAKMLDGSGKRRCLGRQRSLDEDIQRKTQLIVIEVLLGRTDRLRVDRRADLVKRSAEVNLGSCPLLVDISTPRGKYLWPGPVFRNDP